MNYRKFGRTGLTVSEVGFGAWAIGGAAKVGDVPIGWGDADDSTSINAIHAALEAGITFFDTADFYGLGHSENLLGKALKGNNDVVVATKVGHRNIDERIVLDYSKSYILDACEKSLQRLQRDCIDYYQLHSARLAHLQDGDCIEAMEQLKQEGKIRHWGLSLNTFAPAAEAEFLMDSGLGDGFQLVFNLINQRATDTIKSASAKGYGIIARMPLQFGLLTGKFTTSTQFSDSDHRQFRLPKEIMERAISLLEKKVWPLAENEGLSKTSLALQYILSFGEISTVIPGIRTPQQVQLNTEGLKPLSAETETFLQSLSAEWEPIVQMMERQG